ncbi:MAG: hypothetical protein CMP21_00825 [Rickettsiales bacterium]|nr:hypothetical protein [Rickettsiales bacterium]|tara:strand:+ start:1628 stop:2488 length:861 start_codon:yes stop_codon:yes gene_type:complete
MEKCKLKKTILLTGANGFIGKNILESSSNNFIEITKNSYENILELPTLLKIKEKIDVVIHLAAKTYVPDSFKDPYSFYEFNFKSTLNIAEFCKQKKVPLCLYLNTYLYGNPSYLPIDENHKIALPSPYHKSKYFSEQLLLNYFEGITKVISLRLFNVFGKYQSNNFLISKIIEQLNSDKIELNDLNPKRDFIYIKDVTNLINIIISNQNRIKSSEIFNVGTGQSYSVKEILELIQKITKSKIEVIDNKIIRKNEVNDCYADIKKIKQVFNWEPNYSFQEGLKDLLI